MEEMESVGGSPISMSFSTAAVVAAFEVEELKKAITRPKAVCLCVLTFAHLLLMPTRYAPLPARSVQDADE
jgi:hypothetical protein